MFPLWLKPNPDPSSLFDAVSDGKPKANLTDAAKEFLADLRLGNKPEELFYHTLAVLHSPDIAWKIPARCGRIGRACRCPNRAKRCWHLPNWADKSPRCSIRKRQLKALPMANLARN